MLSQQQVSGWRVVLLYDSQSRMVGANDSPEGAMASWNCSDDRVDDVLVNSCNDWCGSSVTVCHDE